MQKYRDGHIKESDAAQDRALRFLYGNVLGRVGLKALTHPFVSKIAGAFMSSPLSKGMIGPFIRKHHLDMSRFETGPFPNYNAFFARKMCPEKMQIDVESQHFISPCDSKLTALPITEDGRFWLKNRLYSLPELLRDSALAKHYQGGWALIFRLTVDDYHRYCFPVDGQKGAQTKIKGVLHTVNPIANEVYPIYHENAREYCVIENDVFGSVLVMEVGALMVGKIVNHADIAHCKRGQEKGFFQFGGSTIVVLLEKGKLKVDEDILQNSKEHIETVVRLGEKIGGAQ